MNDPTIEDCAKSHPGFTIKCDKCGSELVYFESCLGYSAQSGTWGSADLICSNCKQTTELISR